LKIIILVARNESKNKAKVIGVSGSGYTGKKLHIETEVSQEHVFQSISSELSNLRSGKYYGWHIETKK